MLQPISRKVEGFRSLIKVRPIMALVMVALCVSPSIAPSAFADEIESSSPSTLSAEVEVDSVNGGGDDAQSSDSSSKGKLTVDEIRIEGNRLVPTEDIANVLSTKTGDNFSRQKVMQDLRAINRMGYFDDKSLQVVPEVTSGGVLLKIRVVENAPVTQFTFGGNSVVSTEEISNIFSDQLGKPQNINQIATAIDQVEQIYHQKGFVLARVTDVKDYPDGSVNLEINEGEIVDVQIEGNKKTKDFVIKNAIKLGPNSVYNEKHLALGLRKLFSQGYFQDIRRSLAPSPDNPNKYILKVEVDEKRTGSIGVGGGLDSVAGPFGSFSFSDGNFRGKGQGLSFSSQVGSGALNSLSNSINNGGSQFLPNMRTYQLEATWLEPHLRGTDTAMSINGFGRNYASMLIDQAQQRSFGGGVTFAKPLKRNMVASLGLLGENTHMGDIGNLFDSASSVNGFMADRALSQGLASTQLGAEALAGQVRQDQLQGGTFFTVKPTLKYDTRDAAIDTKKGSYASVSAGPSLGLNGSSFAKISGSVSKFVPLGKRATLAFNASGGSGLGGIPQFAQYRIGGWNGIRGYRQFSDLGIGSSMLMATAEIRTDLPIPKNSKVGKWMSDHVKGAAFFDVGTVSGNSLSNNLLARGSSGAAVGVGLRLKVPMLGLVRLDYGIPLIRTALGDLTPRFTVGFGEKF